MEQKQNRDWTWQKPCKYHARAASPETSVHDLIWRDPHWSHLNVNVRTEEDFYGFLFLEGIIIHIYAK